MPQTVGTGWLNSNLLRNYPLSQSATLQSYNSTLRIPDDFLVDLKLHVPYIAALSPAKFHISSITVYPQGLVFSIGYTDTSLTIPVVAVSSPVTFSTFSEYSTVQLKGVLSSGGYDLSQANGMAVIGRVSGIQPTYGTADFDVDGGRLESCTVSFGPRRVSGLRVSNQSGVTSVLSGQVSLASGSNHSIQVTALSGGAGYSLTLNAIDGSGLAESCACSGIELPSCIRTINGVPGDVIGNVNLVGGDCVEVSPADGNTGISISDSCAKPCCGCNELQVVVDDVDAMRTQQNDLALKISQLSSGMSSLQQNCLGSSLDPSSCAQDGD